jgi:hypothetical protein
MKEHFHGLVDSIVLYGVSAIVFINLWRIVAAKLGGMPGIIGTVGLNMGTLTHWSD